MKKQKKTIKERIMRDSSDLIEHKEEDYYKAIRVGNLE